MLAYNLYPTTDAPIVEDTRRYLKQYIARYHRTARWMEIDGNKQIISLSDIVEGSSEK